jgi:hypothetical protein
LGKKQLPPGDNPTRLHPRWLRGMVNHLRQQV